MKNYRPSSSRLMNSEYMKASQKLGGFLGTKLISTTFDTDNKSTSLSNDKAIKVSIILHKEFFAINEFS